MARSCLQALFGGTFVLLVFCILGLAYYIYTLKVYLPLSHCEDHAVDRGAKGVLVFFHILLFMQLWSLVKTMTTDPGVVPPYWGFYMGDAESKRKRYCLMCHVFKPERCHHCSICNRCVLNMDHHCRKRHSAWVNNCIGFCNRKFFIQLLVYTLMLIYYVIVTLFPIAYADLVELSVRYRQTLGEVDVEKLVVVSFFVFVSLLGMVLSAFCKFHLHLVMTNSTTIENLEQAEGEEVSKFSIGPMTNWMQVFGRNPWLWFLPVFGKSGKPLGDGVTWLQERLPPPDDLVSDSARHSVESPRPIAIQPSKSPMSVIKERSVEISPELTEEQNHANVLVVNLSTTKMPREEPSRPGRHSDVDTDSSFLTNAALMKGSSVLQDDSYLREMSAKQEPPSPVMSPGAVLEISLKDASMFREEAKRSSS